jgi:hypothetical protein
MSAALGDDDFYSNLMQYMNQDSLNPFLNSTAMSLSPHEAEKHTLDDDDSVMDEGESKRRGMRISGKIVLTR